MVENYSLIVRPRTQLRVAEAQAAKTPVEEPEAEWEANFILEGTGIRVFAPCGCHYTYMQGVRSHKIDLDSCTLTGNTCTANPNSNPKRKCHHDYPAVGAGWSIARRHAEDLLKRESTLSRIEVLRDQYNSQH